MTAWEWSLVGRLTDLGAILLIGAALVFAARADGRVIYALAWAWWGLIVPKTWYDAAGLGHEFAWLTREQRQWMFDHASALWLFAIATHAYFIGVLVVDVLLPRWRARHGTTTVGTESR